MEISPELAAERGLAGDWVQLTSRRGALEVPVVVTDRVANGTLFISIHQGKPGINLLTGEHHDPDVNTPAYKEIAIRLEAFTRATLLRCRGTTSATATARRYRTCRLRRNGSATTIAYRPNRPRIRRNFNG